VVKELDLDMKLFKLVILITCLAAAAASCDKGGKVRKFTEKDSPTPARAHPSMTQSDAVAPGTASVPGAGTAHSHFKWETPDGWGESNQSSGFRLASFTIKSNDQTREAICTIIPLQGEAGGLKSNVVRWLGQISDGPETSSPDNPTVEQLLKSQEKFLTKGQFPAVFIDFTPVTPHVNAQSILATVITVQGNSVFIKMTGEKSILLQNKEKFISLCKSFAPSSPASPHSTPN
jgi:hypothetical protein